MRRIIPHIHTPAQRYLMIPVLVLATWMWWLLTPIATDNSASVHAQSSTVPFLYLPFPVPNGHHYIDTMTAVFDHSSPNYTRGDRKIVMFNGGVFDDDCHSIDYGGNFVNDCAGSIASFTDTANEFPRQYYNGHDGYDWAIGDSVLAAGSGTVEFVGWDPGAKRCLGYMVVINHNNGYRTTYGHLADGSSTFESDDPVTPDDTIGTVGNSTGCGTSTGPHLHFMVEHWQQATQSWNVTDPFGWIGGVSDPLTDFNEETSSNLWVDGAPHPYGSPPGNSASVPPNSQYMGGALMRDDPPPPPANPTPTPPPTTPPPPSSDGIQIVSVSNHTVSPGAQINPSVTIRVNSGQLLVSRGDHLHAIPEDTTNTFGAWPVQAVKSNVATGGTYTFDVNNDSGFRMTAPNTPGNYVSRWQLRVGGNHIGPVVEIPITVQTAAPPPTPPGWRAQYWNGYFSDNPWGNPRCRSDDYTDSIPFTKNWGSSGPGSGCSGDRFSVLYERTFSFTGGTYRFHCHRDGYCRIFIPALNISHQEEGGPFSGIDWTVNIPAGNWQVKIEYSHKRENGDARLEFWWQGPESYLPPRDVNCAADPYQWCAGYRVAWNSPGDSYMLRRLEGSGYLDHDWAYGSPGYGIYNDFSAEWSRLARFDAGLYRFYTTHDDGVRINLDNQLILDQWGTCCRQDSVDVWVAAGDHRVTVNWFDSGGAANIRVWWQRITPCYSLNATTIPSGLGSVAANPAPNCPSDGSKYVAGTNVTLAANPTAPNDFVGWGGDVSGSTQSLSLVMDADKQVTAGFVRCYSLQLGSDPNGVIATNPSPNCSAGTHYRADTNLALYASASSGYRMDSWLGDLSGNTNPVVISMNGNRSISASFVPLDPLAVTIESFEAIVEAGHVLVSWQTTAEIDNAGFNLYRATDPAGPQTLLAFVPSQAPGSNQGFAYEWADSDVLPDQTYYYWLEAVDIAGGLTLHGPVSVTYQSPTAVNIMTFATLADVSRPSNPSSAALLVLLAGITIAVWRKKRSRVPGHP